MYILGHSSPLCRVEPSSTCHPLPQRNHISSLNVEKSTSTIKLSSTFAKTQLSSVCTSEHSPQSLHPDLRKSSTLCKNAAFLSLYIGTFTHLCILVSGTLLPFAKTQLSSVCTSENSPLSLHPRLRKSSTKFLNDAQLFELRFP